MVIYHTLIIIYLLFFAYLSWRKTNWAIYLLIFTLPSYLIRFQIGSIPTTLLEYMVLILFIIWLFKHRSSRKHKSNPAIKQSSNQAIISKFPNFRITNPLRQIEASYQLPITLFLIAATISIFVSPNLREAAGIWKAYFIEPVLFLTVLINTIDKQKLKKIFLYSCILVFLLSCFAIFQKFTGAFITNPFWAAESTRRVTSIFPYPNALALYLAPLITLFIGLIPVLFKKLNLKNYLKNKNYKIKNSLFTCPSSRRVAYCLLLIISLLSTYFTRSKGALLAILAGLIFYAIFYKPYRKYFISALGIIIILVFLYSCILGNPITLQGNPSVEGGGSLATRTQMWSETWNMLKTKPIFGAGLAGYQTAVAPFHQKNYIEIYLYPHNVILNFWSEVGLLGLIAFIWIIILFYRNGFKVLKQSNNGTIEQSTARLNCLTIPLLASMTTLLVHGLVDVPYFKNDLSILFWLIIGSLIILNTHQNTKSNLNS